MLEVLKAIGPEYDLQSLEVDWYGQRFIVKFISNEGHTKELSLEGDEAKAVITAFNESVQPTIKRKLFVLAMQKKVLAGEVIEKEELEETIVDAVPAKK